MSLYDLAIYIREMFDKGDVEVDVNEVINFARAALKHCRPGHCDHVTSLSILATCLQRRFRCQGAIEDLDQAIILFHTVLETYPSGNEACATPLHELAHCFANRFGKLATMADLLDAIRIEKVALDLHPPGHPDRLESLNSLNNYRQLRIGGQTATSRPARPTDLVPSTQIN
ncbi:hypothetical protein V8B97DRAFT_170099 [Scleroderma yunnanense]